MWIVVIGGVFSVLTLLVKAAIDAGSRTVRTRRAIEGDLELLSKLPDELKDHTSSKELRNRIDRQLHEYAISDLATTAAPAAKRSGLPWFDAAVAVLAVSISLIASGGVSWIADAAEKLDGDLVASVAGITAGIIGVAAGLAANSLTTRHERQTKVQHEIVRTEVVEGQ